MFNSKILSVAVLGLMLSAPAFAQETTTPPSAGGDSGQGRGALHQDIHQDRQTMKSDVQSKNYKGARQERRDVKKDKHGIRKDRRQHRSQTGQ